MSLPTDPAEALTLLREASRSLPVVVFKASPT